MKQSATATIIYDSNTQGLVKGEKFSFRYLDFYFRNGESTSTASQLTSPASQKSKDLNKVLLLLQDLGLGTCPQPSAFIDTVQCRVWTCPNLVFHKYMVKKIVNIC